MVGWRMGSGKAQGRPGVTEYLSECARCACWAVCAETEVTTGSVCEVFISITPLPGTYRIKLFVVTWWCSIYSPVYSQASLCDQPAHS